MGVARDKARREIRNKKRIIRINLLEKQGISNYKFIKRILKKGPEMDAVGKLFTQEDAYEIWFNWIFNRQKRDNKEPKK